MTERSRAPTALDDDRRRRLEQVLSEYPLSFAMVFGSASRGTMDDTSDVDLAVEFEELRPDDEEYNGVYLSLVAALETALAISVDVVDVHTMSPQFARAAFDDGTVLIGSAEKRATLADEIAAEELRVADARERVAAAVERLQTHDS